MTSRASLTQRVAGATLVAATTLCFPVTSGAQAFVSAVAGYNFGGDAGCRNITGCEEKNLNWGVSVGGLGAFAGAEVEFARTEGFFGETASTKTSVTTVMGNFMIAPRFGPVQPYGLAGLGLISSKVEVAGDSDAQNDQDDFGYTVGGGLAIFFSRHVGARADVRYFRSFSVLRLLDLDLDLPDNKLDFGRISGGIIVKF
jgi:opacity protein-like surface antigen